MKIRVRTLLPILGTYLALGTVFFFLGKSSDAAGSEKEGTDNLPVGPGGSLSPGSSSAGAGGAGGQKKPTRKIDIRGNGSGDEKMEPLDSASLDTLLTEIAQVFREGGLDERMIARAWALMQHLGPHDIAPALEYAEGLAGAQGELMMLFLLPRMSAFDGAQAVELVPQKLNGQMRMIGMMTVFANWSSSQPMAAVDWLVESRKAGNSELKWLEGGPMSEELLPMLFSRLAVENPWQAMETLNQSFSNRERKSILEGIAQEAADPGVREALIAELQATESPSERSELAGDIARGWGRQDPRAAIEWVDSLRGELTSDSGVSITVETSALESRWLREEVEVASEYLLGDPSSVHQIARAWVEQDPARGREWLSERAGTATNMDMIFVYGAQNLMGRGNFVEAAAWAAELSSPSNQLASARALGDTWRSQPHGEGKDLQTILDNSGLSPEAIEAALRAPNPPGEDVSD